MSTTLAATSDRYQQLHCIDFATMVGPDYEAGIDGLRTLVLCGADAALEADATAAEGPPPGSAVRAENSRDGNLRRHLADRNFISRCDAIAARKEYPTALEAAEGWGRMAFAKLCQPPLVTDLDAQLDSARFAETRSAFLRLLARLQPNVVFVLGRQLWECVACDGQPLTAIVADPQVAETMYWSNHRSTVAKTPPHSYRMVSEIEYSSGTALMSWAHHPASTDDPLRTYLHVFQSLFDTARDWQKIDELVETSV